MAERSEAGSDAPEAAGQTDGGLRERQAHHGLKKQRTDIGERQLREIRAYVEKEGLNVTVLEGSAGSTNLPAACCDAVFTRDVYHHITQVEAFNKSLIAALKPGGRLAIIDFRPRPGSATYPGVPENRGGHGIAPNLIEQELKAAGFTHVSTTENWPRDEKTALFLVLFTK